MAYIERDIFINNELIPLVKRLDLCHPKQKKGVLMAISKLKEAPAANVVEVKYSNWELKSRVYKMLDDVDEEFYVECPLCHRTEYVPFELEEEKMLEYAREHYPYCHCGAKMDGKDGE